MLLLWCCGTAAAQTAGKTEVLSIGLTRSAMINVNRNDMEAALKVLAQMIARKQNYQVDFQIQYFEDATGFAAAIRNGTVRIVITDSWTYLRMNLAADGIPCFVSLTQGETGKSYLLLTRTNSGLDKLEDLRGKNLSVYETVNTSLGRPWLETLVLQRQATSIESYFSHITSTSKPTTALLPVFFGKSDACLIDAASLAVMTELNPQVGKQLRVIASSLPLLDGMQVLSRNGWAGSEQLRTDLLRTISELHTEPSGQQLLTMFKTDRMAPFAETHLENVLSLWKTHEALRKESRP